MTAPTLNFWLQWLGLLAVEAAAVVLVAAAGHWLLRSALWRRALWQASLVALAALLAGEITGAAGGAIGWLRTGRERSRGVRTESKMLGPMESVSVAPPVVELAAPPPAEPRPSAPQPKATWWPGAIWLSGTAILLGYALTTRLMFTLCRGRRRAVADPAVLARVAALAEGLRLKFHLRVWEADPLCGPVSCGLMRRAIGLPVHFARDFSPRQQEAMLAHELAHLSAHDPAWHALADAVAGLLWWHPLVWWARRRWRMASETAADEAALLVEQGPQALAECLVALGSRLLSARRAGWLGIQGGGFRSGLGRRVERLMGLGGRPWQPLRRWQRWAAGLLGPLLLMGLVVGGSVWAQPRPGTGEDWRQNWNESLAGRVFLALAERGEVNAPAPPAPALGLGAEWPAPGSGASGRQATNGPTTAAAIAPAKPGGPPRRVRNPADDRVWEPPPPAAELERQLTNAVARLLNPSTRLEGFAELMDFQQPETGARSADNPAVRKVLKKSDEALHEDPALPEIVEGWTRRLGRPETRMEALKVLIKCLGFKLSMRGSGYGGTVDNTPYGKAQEQAGLAIDQCADVETLARALESPDRALRFWAVTKVTDRISQADWKRLAPSLKRIGAEDDAGLRSLIAQRFQFFPDTKEFIQERLQVEAGPNVLMQLTQYRWRSDRDWKKDFLVLFRPLLDHPDERVRLDALRFIGANSMRAPVLQFAFGRDVFDRVMELTESQSVQERAGAARALSDLKEPALEPRRQALLRLIKDDYAEVRSASAFGLRAEKQRPEVAQALQGLLKDPSSGIRFSAILVLGSTNYVKELETLARGPDDRVAEDAARELKAMAERKKNL